MMNILTNQLANLKQIPFSSLRDCAILEHFNGSDFLASIFPKSTVVITLKLQFRDDLELLKLRFFCKNTVFFLLLELFFRFFFQSMLYYLGFFP